MGFLKKIFGDYSSREIKRITPIKDKVLALEEEYSKLTDEELKAKTPYFKERLANGETLDDILPEAFAAVREAAWRVLGMKPFRVQLIGGIVLGYIWNLIINGVLAIFGVDITFKAEYGFWGLVILTNWQLIGYMMVIYIAGLQNIPRDLNEAAEIDGASHGQILRKITIPMVMPSVTICTFLTLTNSFKLFDQNLALTAGAPGRETAMLALDIYNTFYGRTGWQGAGQAKAVIFFAITAVIAFVQLKITSRREVQS